MRQLKWFSEKLYSKERDGNISADYLPTDVIKKICTKTTRRIYRFRRIYKGNER